MTPKKGLKDFLNTPKPIVSPQSLTSIVTLIKQSYNNTVYSICLYGYLKNIIQYLNGSTQYITKIKNIYKPIFKFIYKSPTTSSTMHENMLNYVAQTYPDLMNPEPAFDTDICSIFLPDGSNKGYINFIIAPKEFLSSGNIL